MRKKGKALSLRGKSMCQISQYAHVVFSTAICNEIGMFLWTSLLPRTVTSWNFLACAEDFPFTFDNVNLTSSLFPFTFSFYRLVPCRVKINLVSIIHVFSSCSLLFTTLCLEVNSVNQKRGKKSNRTKGRCDLTL